MARILKVTSRPGIRTRDSLAVILVARVPIRMEVLCLDGSRREAAVLGAPEHGSNLLPCEVQMGPDSWQEGYCWRYSDSWYFTPSARILDEEIAESA